VGQNSVITVGQFLVVISTKCRAGRKGLLFGFSNIFLCELSVLPVPSLSRGAKPR